MATILDRIVDTKWREIAALYARFTDVQLEAYIADLRPARDFHAAVTRPGMNVIAEVKKASPSAGVLRPDFDAVRIAAAYTANGAAAISVLTDVEYFQGDLGHLTAVHDFVSVPVLRKDFILDRIQLLEACLAGADAVLLIAECLPGDLLKTLYRQATELGLGVLVELHDAEELPRVLDSGATLVGINNRDLRTFETKLSHTLDLMPRVPAGVNIVSESGIKTRADLDALAAAGVKAVLVGESLVRQPDPGAALAMLLYG